MHIKELDKDTYTKLTGELRPHIMQSYIWGEIKRPQWDPLRLAVYEEDKIVSIITILRRRIPIIGRHIGYIPRGIIVKDQGMLSKIFNHIKKELPKYKILTLLIDPDVDLNNYFDSNKEANKLMEDALSEAGFSQIGRTMQPMRTIIIDLSKDEDALLSEMRSKHRQYIRKAKRNGVKIRMGNVDDFETFYKILRDISEQKAYEIHTKEYHENAYKMFDDEGKAALFMAEVNGEVVGSYMVFYDERIAYEMYGGCGEKGKNLLANYALKWASVQHAKNLSKKFYDQWGAEFIYPGLVQFKEGFGGKVIEYPKQYAYSPVPFGVIFYQLMQKTFSIARNLLSR
jgi:lipid II:glycine glycyltransferase (peptidoglycan interpeptide bridge formation enzyme)